MIINIKIPWKMEKLHQSGEFYSSNENDA